VLQRIPLANEQDLCCLVDPDALDPEVRSLGDHLAVSRDLLMALADPMRQDLVLASYNAGEGAVQKYNNKIPPYPETINYVKLVSAFYDLYQPMELTLGNRHFNRIRMTLPARQNIGDTLPELSDATDPYASTPD